MRVLVTGGAGFIGSHLVDRLILDGADVTVLDNRIRSTANLDVVWKGNGQIRFEANACAAASHEAIFRR